MEAIRPLSENRTGVSLVEVLVATAVLTAVLVPLLYLLSQTVRGTEVSLDEIRATNLAAELLEQLQVTPFATGYAQFAPRPIPNPPPDFPFFLSMDPHSGQLPLEGRSFCCVLGGDEQPLPAYLDTKEWVLNGNNYCADGGPQPDPLVAERSRLFLSAMPEGYARYVQTYNPMVDPDSNSYDPYLTKIVVKVEWTREFMTGQPVKRQVRLSTLVAAPWR